MDKKCQLCDGSNHEAKQCPVFRCQYKLWFVKKVWYEHCDGWTDEEEEIQPIPEELVELVIDHNKRKNVGWQNIRRYPLEVPFDHKYFDGQLKKNGDYYDDKLLEAKIYVVSE